MVIDKSLIPEIKDGIGGFEQQTFIKYNIYNHASHDNLIKSQSISLFPRIKKFKLPESDLVLPKFKNTIVYFPFNYTKISKYLIWNIGIIKIRDIKNRKITKYFWFKPSHNQLTLSKKNGR